MTLTEVFESEAFSEEMDGRPMTGAEALAIMERDRLFLAPREGDPDSPELARGIREAAWRRTSV
jgi:hypothetical protein